MHVWAPFFGPRGHYKLSLGAIWNFSMEQGSPELITDYGATKGPVIRPRYFGAVRVQS